MNKFTQCVVCGRDFEKTGTRQKCCTNENCQREFKRWQALKRDESRREKYKRSKLAKILKKNTLVEDAMAAKEAGMTYGQYKSWQRYQSM